MASTPQDAEANALLWKSYATAILRMLNGGSTELGDNDRVFIASSNHSAIPGGSEVPQEITNWGIYNLGDKLLNPSGGITFSPTKSMGGYVDALSNFLLGAKPAIGDKNPASQHALSVANQVLATAQAAHDNTRVWVMWTAARNNDSSLSFDTWLPNHRDDEYDRALQALEAAQDEADDQDDVVNGVGHAQLAVYKKLMTKITSHDALLEPGVNMDASEADITMNAETGSLSTPKDLHVFRVPAYTITSYGETIDGWLNTTPGSQPPILTTTISTSDGQSFDANAFGHSDSGGSHGFDMGVFSVGGGGGSSTDSSSFQFGQWADQITLTLTVNFASTMTISAGTWWFDAKNFIDKIGGTSSPKVKTGVWPTQALFANGVSINVQFGSEAASQFDTWYKHNENASGGYSIFGYHFGGTAASSVTNATNNHTWASTTGTLTVTPAATAYNSQLLAVMGEVITL